MADDTTPATVAIDTSSEASVEASNTPTPQNASRVWVFVAALFGPLVLLVAAIVYKARQRRFKPGTWGVAWCISLAPTVLVGLLLTIALAAAGRSAPATSPSGVAGVQPTAPIQPATAVPAQSGAGAATACPPPVAGPVPSGLNTASPEASFVAAVGESTGDDPCTAVKKAFKVLDRAFCDENPAYLPFFWQDDSHQGISNGQALIAEERQRQEKLCGDQFNVTAVVASSPTSFTVEGDYGWQYRSNPPWKHGQLTMVVNPDASNPARWIAACLDTTCPTQPAVVEATPSASLNLTSDEAQFVVDVGESTSDNPATTVHKAFDKIYAQAFSDEDAAYLPFFWYDDSHGAITNDQGIIAQEKQRQRRLMGEQFTNLVVIASSPTSFTVEGDYGWTALPSRHGQLTMVVNPDQSSPAKWLATCLAATCP